MSVRCPFCESPAEKPCVNPFGEPRPDHFTRMNATAGKAGPGPTQRQVMAYCDKMEQP